jgi:hypothetical protein
MKYSFSRSPNNWRSEKPEHTSLPTGPMTSKLLVRAGPKS